MSAVYGNDTFQNVVLTILACVVLGVLVWCIYTFIRAIFFFIFAGTKEENKKKWRNSIRFMIIGLIMTALLLFLISPILGLMNVTDNTVYTSKNIVNKAWEVLNYVFRLGNVIQKSQQDQEYRGNLYFDTTPNTVQPSSSNYQL